MTLWRVLNQFQIQYFPTGHKFRVSGQDVAELVALLNKYAPNGP